MSRDNKKIALISIVAILIGIVGLNYFGVIHLPMLPSAASIAIEGCQTYQWQECKLTATTSADIPAIPAYCPTINYYESKTLTEGTFQVSYHPIDVMKDQITTISFSTYNTDSRQLNGIAAYWNGKIITLGSNFAQAGKPGPQFVIEGVKKTLPTTDKLRIVGCYGNPCTGDNYFDKTYTIILGVKSCTDEVPAVPGETTYTCEEVNKNTKTGVFDDIPLQTQWLEGSTRYSLVPGTVTCSQFEETECTADIDCVKTGYTGVCQSDNTCEFTPKDDEICWKLSSDKTKCTSTMDKTFCISEASYATETECKTHIEVPECSVNVDCDSGEECISGRCEHIVFCVQGGETPWACKYTAVWDSTNCKWECPPSWFEENKYMVAGISVLVLIISVFIASEYKKGNLTRRK